MTLPVPLPLEPMEAQPVAALPDGAGWQYEPKWDGFRCLVYRDSRKVEHPVRGAPSNVPQTGSCT